MKKFGKILLSVVLTAVVALVAIVVTLPYTINPLVKTAASVGGPKVLGVPVSVGNVSLSPLSGRLTLSRLSVGNPKGFSEKPAFEVGQVDVGIRIGSLLGGDTIVVRKIGIDAPAISYESKDGKSNFDAILSNAKKSESEEKSKTPSDKKGGKKVVIEEFALNGAKVSYSSAVTFGKPVTLPLPGITLNDIGKASGGVSAVEAVTEVLNAIVGGLSQAVIELAGSAGDAAKSVLKTGGDAAKGLTEALGGSSDDVKKSAEAASDAVKDAAKGLKKLFK